MEQGALKRGVITDLIIRHKTTIFINYFLYTFMLDFGCFKDASTTVCDKCINKFPIISFVIDLYKYLQLSI